MEFKYLYNTDNGICHPYSTIVAENRSDLVPLLADELNLIRTMSIADIIARRARLETPTVSVTIETDNVASETPNEQEAVSDTPIANNPAPKGVVVIGKVENPTTNEIEFEDKPKDYKGYCIYSGDIFPIENLPSVPDCDLVRFAKEVLKKDYEDAPVIADDIERANYYLGLRGKIAKSLSRINKKRLAKKAAREAANNGVND